MKRTIIVLAVVASVLVGALWAAGAVLADPGDRTPGRGPGWGGMMGWRRHGMMDDGWGRLSGSCPYGWGGPGDTTASPVTSLEAAAAAVEAYVDDMGLDDVHVTEVMEFSRNYYAIIAEDATDIGAMELLVNPETGRVTPEPGPNMMWNTRYGMHRRGMMGAWGGWGDGDVAMAVSPDEAQAIAQAWLDANLPGRAAGEADEFYGYYTLHFLRDGHVEGMLSVHGQSGTVWYHSWHGEFVQMTEHDD